MKCHQCNSTDVIEGLTVVDRGSNNNKHELEIELRTAPNALVFKQVVSAKVLANVCGSCGNVMLQIEPGRISAIRGASEGMKLINKNGNIKEHELYKEFIEGDAARKHLNLGDQLAEFAAWMQRR
jgi:hypothetical protein